MAIPGHELAIALRTLLKLNGGFYIGDGLMVEIGQHENLNGWVQSKNNKDVAL